MKHLGRAAATAAALLVLAGCGQGTQSKPGAHAPSTSSPTTVATPSSPPASSPPTSDPGDTVDAYAGQWHSSSADWTVHLSSDGSFVEDFQGNEGIRSGTWEAKGTHLILHGGDGEDDTGTIKGDTIVFRLGTLTRQN